MFKAIAAVVGVVVLLFAFTFASDAFNLFEYKFWAPKQANAEHEVFQNTQAYVDGKVTMLSRLQRAYEDADGQQKRALRATILDEASTVDNTKLPANLQAFISTLREE